MNDMIVVRLLSFHLVAPWLGYLGRQTSQSLHSCFMLRELDSFNLLCTLWYYYLHRSMSHLLQQPYVSLLSTPNSPRSTKPDEPTSIATASFVSI
ncbi:hypothetical protein CSPX01_00396 [Colletotrichum filicis]|nr:hypothetical protein CSPX01_00396 [Colletotrichum filicis]